METIRGKYRIVREIARSNDIVYEATDTSLGRRIALKELNIPSSLAGQARRERIERFNREARAAGRLSHPNIVSVFDFGEENGRHFIAMEFLEGQTLRDTLMARNSLPLKEAIHIASQVLDALGYAHANKVIHRDIKPDNIQVLPGGQVKLTDFGIARLTEEANLTLDGQVFGTPSYMSPEQVVGRGIDSRSDLFSLAVVLYEMLCGRKPFSGDSVVSITYAIMNAQPQPMAGVAPAIERVVFRALAKDPNQRYSSADEMKRELQAAEQIPLSMQPRMGASNPYGNATNYGYQNAGMPAPPPMLLPGGATGYNGQAQPYGAQPGYAPPANMSAPPPNAALPWNFNGNGAGNGNAPQANPQVPVPVFAAGAAGSQPFGAPRRMPRAPFVSLSPTARTWLSALSVAVVLGTCLAFGVIAFMRSYDRYRDTMGKQQVAVLINEGVRLYNAGDYASAAAQFEKALQANPTGVDRGHAMDNLTAAYIQSARQCEDKSDWMSARGFCQKALTVSPDSKLAHTELANVLERLGDMSGSQKERQTAQSIAGAGDGSPSGSGVGSESSHLPPTEEFMEDRRAQAKRLIEEGDQLFTSGKTDEAHDKWLEAVGRAPGTPEYELAKKRLDSTPSASSSNSGGGL